MGARAYCERMTNYTGVGTTSGVPLVLGGVEGIPAPALTLCGLLLGMVLTLGTEWLTVRALWESLRTRRDRRRRGVTRYSMTFAAHGDLAEVVAAMADRTDGGFDDIDAALKHEGWLRRSLHREIVRRGGGRRELEQLRRTPVLFTVRISSTAVDFGWNGQVGFVPFHEWISSAGEDLDAVRIVTRPTDAVVGQVFTDAADASPVSVDAHALHVPTGLDDPAVGGAVVPTGPPAAVRTTPNRVLLAAA